jgi:putative MATE family efflux protein
MLHKKVDKFIEDPKKALFKLALPITLAMFVQIMYNIVDTAFVGRLGADAIAALTFSFPIFFILMALNNGISVGMSSRISRFLGSKEIKNAENTAIHGFLLCFLVGVSVFAIGMGTLKPIFGFFGAEGIVMELAISYMEIILIGVLFMFLANVLVNIFSAQGNTKVHMKVQIFALVINMILDPIFIYVFGLGVRGAAISSAISFTLAFLLTIYYIRTKSHLHLKKESFNFSYDILKDIAKVGTPVTMNLLIMSFYVIFLNRFMSHFGTDYIASLGLYSRLESFAVMPVMGFAMATMTLTAMFYGAKRYDLLKNISWYSIRISILFTLIMAILFFAFPSIILRIFTSDKTLLLLASNYVRIMVFVFPLMAIGLTSGRILQGIGKGLPGLVITSVRVFVVSIPLAYVFVFILDYSYLSIGVAMVLGGLVSVSVAVTWLVNIFKKLEKELA